MKMNLILAIITCICLSFSCDKSSDKESTTEIPNETTTSGVDVPVGKKAEIVGVQVSGTEGAYTFNVTIKSPDTGCQQYADWWEVISMDGALISRRILAHSHVTEQPFTRSGSNINCSSAQKVYVRAHMNSSGYGNVVFTGSVDAGFENAFLEDAFAAVLAKEAPLPGDCAF